MIACVYIDKSSYFSNSIKCAEDHVACDKRLDAWLSVALETLSKTPDK